MSTNPMQPEQNAPMRERLHSLRHGIAAACCDAYCSLSPPANAYLTGFRGSASALIVTASEAHFLCDFRYTEQARGQVQNYAVIEVAGTLETRVGEHLRALDVQVCGFDPAVTTVHQRTLIEAAFRGDAARLKPLPGLVAGLRLRKSPDEIEQIRAASNLAEAALHDVLAALEEGMPERECAARLEYEFKKRGAQGAAFDSIALFGPRSSLPHGAPAGKTLERGDIVLIDCGCTLEGYCSDLTRTHVFGTMPGAWFEEVYALTLSAQEAALAAVRPGRSCRELDAIARNIISEAGHGEHFGHGLGHGVGIEVHEAPRLNKDADSVLDVGMVVTIEPGIYLPGRGGVRIEDLLVVTKTGCEVLTQSSKELKVLGV